jgi:hypothetical protein
MEVVTAVKEIADFLLEWGITDFDAAHVKGQHFSGASTRRLR